MNVLVLDAGVAAKWLLPAKDEPLSSQASALHLRYTRAEVRIVVPDMFWAEVGNAVWNAARRGRITTSVAERAIAELVLYTFGTVPSRTLLKRAFALAASLGRSVYDCLYVALAIESNAHMVTADERLANSVPAGLPIRWLGTM